MAVGGGGIAIESVGDAAAPMIGGAGIFSADAVGAMGVSQVNRIGLLLILLQNTIKD